MIVTTKRKLEYPGRSIRESDPTGTHRIQWDPSRNISDYVGSYRNTCKIRHAK